MFEWMTGHGKATTAELNTLNISLISLSDSLGLIQLNTADLQFLEPVPD